MSYNTTRRIVEFKTIDQSGELIFESKIAEILRIEGTDFDVKAFINEFAFGPGVSTEYRISRSFCLNLMQLKLYYNAFMTRNGRIPIDESFYKTIFGLILTVNPEIYSTLYEDHKDRGVCVNLWEECNAN